MCDDKIKTTTTYDFNMKHISFNDSNLDKSEFMNNHNSKYRDYYDISDDDNEDDTDDENEEGGTNYDIVVDDVVDNNNDDSNPLQ
jgi:hypothetical protein